MSDPVFDGQWRLISDKPDIGERRWIMRHPVQPNAWVVKTETWVPSLVAEANAEDLKASDGKRWGDGKIAARVPMSTLYGELLEPLRDGDKNYIRRFLNDSDNAWMRTFKGNL